MVAVAVGIIFLIIRKIDEVSDATKLQKDFCHSIRIGCVRVTLYPFHFQNLSRNRNRNLETYRSQSLYLKSQKKRNDPYQTSHFFPVRCHPKSSTQQLQTGRELSVLQTNFPESLRFPLDLMIPVNEKRTLASLNELQKPAVAIGFSLEVRSSFMKPASYTPKLCPTIILSNLLHHLP